MDPIKPGEVSRLRDTFCLVIFFCIALTVVYMTRATVEGDSSDLPVSATVAPDTEEDVTLGNISTEAQVNFQLTEVTVLYNQF